MHALIRTFLLSSLYMPVRPRYLYAQGTRASRCPFAHLAFSPLFLSRYTPISAAATARQRSALSLGSVEFVCVRAQHVWCPPRHAHPHFNGIVHFPRSVSVSMTICASICPSPPLFFSWIQPSALMSCVPLTAPFDPLRFERNLTASRPAYAYPPRAHLYFA